ncbi:hypothetical protein KAI58_03015 [Candidatus Gracilibacteria bacterium]|nr:hypothetical protein [Candidatus Gracilibacteria bacterium]
MTQDKNASFEPPNPSLTKRQREIVSQIDRIYGGIEGTTVDSKVFITGVNLLDPNFSSMLPDWRAAVAHCFRELLYNLGKAKEHSQKLKTGGSETADTFYDIFYYCFFTNICHHSKEKKKNALVAAKNILNQNLTEIDEANFRIICDKFEDYLNHLLLDQVGVYEKIDSIIENGVKNVNLGVLRKLINSNQSAGQHFYKNIGEDWFEFLKTKKLLELLNQEFEGDKRWTCPPQCAYIRTLGEQSPETLQKVILGIKVSDKTSLNVVNSILWALESMSAKLLVPIANKICMENWVKVAGELRNGFLYKKVLEILVEGGEVKSSFRLFKTLFTLKPIPEDDKLYSERAVYFDDYEITNFCQTLLNIPEEYYEEVLKEVGNIYTNFCERKTAKRKSGKKTPVFDYDDPLDYTVKTVNSLEIGKKGDYHSLYRVEEILASTIKWFLSEQFKIHKKNLGKSEFQKEFDSIFSKFPNISLFKRLELYFLNTYRSLLKRRLKDVLFEFLDRDFLVRGEFREYEILLRDCFSSLTEIQRNKYIELLFKASWSENEELNLHIKSNLLSIISDYLTSQHFEEAKKRKIEVIEDFEIDTQEEFGRIARGVGGVAPLNLGDIEKMEVRELVTYLKNTKIVPQERDEPSISGLRGILTQAVENNPSKFSKNALLFADPEIRSDYVYAFFEGIQKSLQKQNENSEPIEYGKIFDLMLNIVQRDNVSKFPLEAEKETFWEGILYGWSEVFRGMLSLVEEILRLAPNQIQFEFLKYQETIFQVIEYFTHNPDPKVEDEPTKADKENSWGGDPLHIAINSLRGRAIEALFLFLWREYLNSPDRKNYSFSPKIRKVLDDHLDEKKEATTSIRILYGKYFTWLFFDRKWLEENVKKIFPKDTNPRLFWAAWEGYLMNNLSKEMFEFMLEYYKFSVSVDTENYSRRNYLKSHSLRKGEHQLDKSIGDHYAIAFAFDFMEFDSPEFKYFFQNANSEKKAHFIDWLGRSTIERSDDNDKRCKNAFSSDKFLNFWNWYLQQENVSQKELSKFCYWVSQTTFDVEKMLENLLLTLQCSNGELEWEYELMKNIEFYAKKSPKTVTEILKIILMKPESVPSIQTHFGIYEKEIFSTFKFLWEIHDNRNDIRRIVSFFVKNGAERFREIVEA